MSIKCFSIKIYSLSTIAIVCLLILILEYKKDQGESALVVLFIREQYSTAFKRSSNVSTYAYNQTFFSPIFGRQPLNVAASKIYKLTEWTPH